MRLRRGPRRAWCIAAAALLWCAASGSLGAQAPGAVAPPPQSAPSGADGLEILLVTFGQGEEVFERFGHNAIWVHDPASGADVTYDWGNFSFRQPHFLRRFLTGDTRYWMEAKDANAMVDFYRRLGRTITIQRLNLTAEQKASLREDLRRNALEENRYYRYDYFVDNCSTRPRDLLDLVLGGQLHAHSSQLTDASYRSEALRLMQGDKPLVVGVHIGLGEPSDRKITMWQEMFLPRRLHDVVGSLQVRDSSGATHPLVRSEHVLFQATRPPEAEAPPNLAPWLTAIGLVLAAIFAWLGARAAAGSRGARIGAAIAMSIYCVAAGVLGLLLTALWTVTDHVFAHRNENLLLFNPLWLVLAVLIAIAMWSGRAARATRMLAAGLAGLSVIALVAHLVMVSAQVNLAVIGLALPPALAIAWAAARARA